MRSTLRRIAFRLVRLADHGPGKPCLAQLVSGSSYEWIPAPAPGLIAWREEGALDTLRFIDTTREPQTGDRVPVRINEQPCATSTKPPRSSGSGSTKATAIAADGERSTIIGPVRFIQTELD